MDSFTTMISFSVSMCSALFTIYFWITKARMERACLKTYPVEPHMGGHAFSSHGDPIKLIFEPKLIVANYSSLPNALLGVRAWLKTREGGWLPAKVAPDVSTPLPINVPPLQTVRLNLSVPVEVPACPEGEECRNTSATFRLYRDRFLPAELELKLELTGLGETPFMTVVKYPPKPAAEANPQMRLVG